MKQDSNIPGLVWRKGRLTLPLPIESGAGLLSSIFAIAIPFLVVAGRRGTAAECVIQHLPSVRQLLSSDSSFADVACRAQSLLTAFAVARSVIIIFATITCIPRYSSLYKNSWEVTPYARDACFITLCAGTIFFTIGLIFYATFITPLRNAFNIFGLMSIGIILLTEGVACSVIFSYMYLRYWCVAAKTFGQSER